MFPIHSWYNQDPFSKIDSHFYSTTLNQKCQSMSSSRWWLEIIWKSFSPPSPLVENETHHFYSGVRTDSPRTKYSVAPPALLSTVFLPSSQDKIPPDTSTMPIPLILCPPCPPLPPSSFSLSSLSRDRTATPAIEINVQPPETIPLSCAFHIRRPDRPPPLEWIRASLCQRQKPGWIIRKIWPLIHDCDRHEPSWLPGYASYIRSPPQSLIRIVARIFILSLLIPIRLLCHHGHRRHRRRPSSSLLFYYRPFLRRRKRRRFTNPIRQGRKVCAFPIYSQARMIYPPTCIGWTLPPQRDLVHSGDDLPGWC